MDTEKSSGDLLIQSLAGGDMSVFDKIYKNYRDDFIRWAATRVQVSGHHDLLDAWHDTMIMFYEQVRDKKLTHLTCELKTFLFLIGYRRLLRLHKKMEKIDLVEEVEANVQVDDSINSMDWEELHDERSAYLAAAVDELPEQSRKILILRYVEKKSIPDIVQAMGYTSVNAVSVTLSRSLKKLKSSIMDSIESKKEWKKQTRS